MPERSRTENAKDGGDPPGARPDPDPHGWREERRDLLRGIAAGSIVGMPLLYTMEMWWHGMTLGEGHLLLLLGVTLVVNFGFSLLSGFRPQFSTGEAASESVTAVGIGMLYSFAVLWLIGEITFKGALSDILGKVLIETAPVSLGISFANYQIRSRSREGDEDDGKGGGGKGGREQDEDPERLQLKQDLKDLAATVSGATIFAYNMAPTEEIIMIASRLSAWQHLLLMAASLVLCHMILFAAGFQKRQVHVKSMFQSPAAETVMAYAVSLLVSFALLQLVGTPGTGGEWSTTVAATVTLALPAVVGASAGRLIV